MRTHTNRFTSGGPKGSAALGSPPRFDRGFTLIELMIVIAIIATIASIAVPKAFTALDNARIVRAMSEIRTLSSELAIYEQRNPRR